MLPLGRALLNPDLEVSKEFRWEDDSFQDKLVDEENKIRNPKFSLFYNLVVGQAVGDLDDIEKGEFLRRIVSSFAMQQCTRPKASLLISSCLQPQN